MKKRETIALIAKTIILDKKKSSDHIHYILLKASHQALTDTYKLLFNPNPNKELIKTNAQL